MTWKEVVLFMGLCVVPIMGAATHVIEQHQAGELLSAVVGMVVGRFIPTKGTDK